jgi:hypothetical protein
MTKKTVLGSWNDVEAELGILGNALAEKRKVESPIKVKIAALKAELDEKTDDLDRAIERSQIIITQYVEAHIEEIRQDGKKSMKFSTGEIRTKDHEEWDYPEDDELVSLIESLERPELLYIEKIPAKAVIRALAKNEPDILEKLNIETHKEPKITIKAV